MFTSPGQRSQTWRCLRSLNASCFIFIQLLEDYDDWFGAQYSAGYNIRFLEGRLLISLVNDTNFQKQIIDEEFTCPSTHFECSFTKYCMPIFLRCNGKICEGKGKIKTIQCF